ncbi:MAG: hypothetical protein ACR2HJ_12710 [Fimbriimonadales bacterium]
MIETIPTLVVETEGAVDTGLRMVLEWVPQVFRERLWAVLDFNYARFLDGYGPLDLPFVDDDTIREISWAEITLASTIVFQPQDFEFGCLKAGHRYRGAERRESFELVIGGP